MNLHFLIRGFLIGFSIAAPVGPIGVLCIHRTLAKGRIPGLITGLGAATADMIYGSVAAYGLMAVSNFLTGWQLFFRIAGGLFLLSLGHKIFKSSPPVENAPVLEQNFRNDYFFTLFLTLTNPATILSFAAVFAGFGLGGMRGDFTASTCMVAGVFLGSASWWLVLTGGVGFLRSKLDLTSFAIINKISGTMIVLFGIAAILSGLRNIHA